MRKPEETNEFILNKVCKSNFSIYFIIVIENWQTVASCRLHPVAYNGVARNFFEGATKTFLLLITQFSDNHINF